MDPDKVSSAQDLMRNEKGSINLWKKSEISFLSMERKFVAFSEPDITHGDYSLLRLGLRVQITGLNHPFAQSVC